MSWIKFDDQWMDHPKIIQAGRDARDMWIASITYCAKHLTDGYFHDNLLPTLAVMAGVDVANCQEFASTLVRVGLWDANEEGYQVHDYLDYNPSKEQALATREARKEAGRAGGIAKASKNPGKTLAKTKQNSAPSPSPSPSLKIEEEGRDEVDNPDEPTGILAPYEHVFVEETKLPPFSGGPERWFKGLKVIQAMGATPEDFRQAIRAQANAAKNGRSYNMTSPASFVTATANVVARRNVKPAVPAMDPAAAQRAAQIASIYRDL
jgi:hypothetical protein